MSKLAITLLALLPSFWMLWQSGGIPHLGYFHDDGIYAGTAASVADGNGLRLQSLPGEPYQIKYPPLFPLYLALGVKWEPALTFLVWVLLPALMFLLWRWKNDPWIVLLLGWNVYSVVFASLTLSELFGTVLLLISIRQLEQNNVRSAAFCAGLTYLARTALIAFPAGAVLWLLLKKRWRDAALFTAIFSVFFVAWNLYMRAHTTPNITPGAVYYLSYTQFFVDNMNADNVANVLSINAQALLNSLGGILFFNSGDSFLDVNFARLLLFASISGLVREVRRDGVSPYILMVPPYLVLLTVWNFVPNERFLYPLLPLLLSGLVAELRHIYAMLQSTWEKQRGATIIIGAVVAAGALWMVERNGVSAWVNSPSLPRIYQDLRADREAAYAWIRANTPADANFLTYEDPALRRHTGRHGLGIHCPTRFFYANDTKNIFAFHDDLIRTMPIENLQYVLIGPNDLAQDINAPDREKILKDWRTRPDLRTVYENPRYQIRQRLN
jgi:hypothetical protein